MPHHKLFTAALFFILSSCSGGGSSPSPQSQQQPASENVSLAMSEANAIDVANYGVSVVENLLQLAGLAANLVQQTIDMPQATRTDSCDNGGLVDFEFTDVDQNGEPSTGDTIRALYRDCYLAQLNKTVAGDFVITISENTRGQQGVVVQSGSIDIADLEMADDLGTVLSLEDSFDFAHQDALLENTLEVSGNAVFVLNDGSRELRDEIDSFQFKRILDRASARYSVTATGEVSSQVLEGRFEIVTEQGISGFMGTFPEEGAFQFVGANGDSIEMEANLVTNSDSADVVLNRSSDGATEITVIPWNDSTDGFLWSTSNTSTDEEIRLFDANRLELLASQPITSEVIGEAFNIPVFGPLDYQFSRPLDAGLIPNTVELILLHESGTELDAVMATAELNGAFLRIIPSEQLMHGRNYRGPRLTDSSDIVAQDQFGNQFSISARNVFTARNNLRSAISELQSDVIVASESLSLNGLASESDDGDIQSFLWTQIAGPEGSFDESDEPETVFTLPAVTNPSTIELQLQVSNAAGESDSSSIEFEVFESVQAASRILLIEGDAGTLLMGSSFSSEEVDGTVNAFDVFEETIGVNFINANTGEGDWAITFAANNNINPGADRPLTVGSYEMTSSTGTDGPDIPIMWIRGPNSGCAGRGRFEVLEFERDESNAIQRLAIDFQHSCSTADQSALRGNIRIHSSIALP